MNEGIDPDHPILRGAWEWEIVGLSIQRAPDDAPEPYLDLKLTKDGQFLTLRFWNPQNLEIGAGGPTMTHGLMILDVSGRGLEGLGVRVDDFENDPSYVRFWARSVEAI